MYTHFIKIRNRFLALGFRQRLSVRPKLAPSSALLLIAPAIAALFTLTGCGSSAYTSSASTSVTPPALPQATSLPTACASATTGSSYSCQIAVTNGKGPFTWAVTGLPKGMSFSVSADTTTLTISGTPQAQAVGAFSRTTTHSAATPDATTTTTANVTITVTDANGKTATLSFTITVTSTIATLAITTNSLPGGTAGAAYSASVTAAGGLSPYTWGIFSLPKGLIVASGSPSASISGTTDQVGTFTVSVTVADSQSPPATASASLTLTIAQAATLMISTTTLANGTVNVPYSETLTATGGVAPDTWALANGSLPAGLSLSPNGVISGIPTASASASFTVTVSDAESPAQTAMQALSLTINTTTSGLNITTTSPLPNASLNTAYTASVTATGGTPPYTWTLAPPSVLPAGLSLTSATPSATISGTPTVNGTFSFTLHVTDSASTPATAAASFLLTVSAGSNLNCPATVNLTLCGFYAFGLRGFNSSGGPTAFGGTFYANNSGLIVSGASGRNDSVTGLTTFRITGGSYVMDASGDGRGVLTLVLADASQSTFRFTLESAANSGPGPIEEFDNSGTLSEGILVGPNTSPVPPIAANTTLSLALEGVNGSGQRSALLGNFAIGSAGCNGTTGSFNSQAGEPLIVNTAGAVNASLTATGVCLPPDTNTGVGGVQITLSGGTPFTTNTLNFVYIEVVGQGVFFLETDAIGNNQAILSGLGIPAPAPGSVTAAQIAGLCPCLLVTGATTTGTVTSGADIASIVRVGALASGALSGVVDENAGGTITTQGVWPYTSYTADSNGVGTISGPGQPTIHFVIDSSGDVDTLDESGQVRVGGMRPQNSLSIESPGSPYITSRQLGELGVTRSTVHVSGVVVPTGTATAGTLSGTVDVIGAAGSFPASAVSGSYNSISATTGRGTGTAQLTAGNTVNIVIYAFRHRVFLMLDVQSSNPYVQGVRLQ